MAAFPHSEDLRKRLPNPIIKSPQKRRVAMSIAKSIIEKQVKLNLPKREILPTMYDLPSEEESGLPDEYHLLQSELCTATFSPDLSPDEVFVASDLNLYYDSNHTQWYKRPDGRGR